VSRSSPPVKTAPQGEPLGPDSLVWRLGFPRAGLLLAGRALVLQTAHPVVGAGVRDHSDFTEDPWGRLDRTLRSLQLQLFGGEDARIEAARLRDLHGSITGVGFDGRRYHALDPAAYAWVHLSNFDTTLAYHRWFGPSLDRAEQEQLYAEWRRVGLVLGVRGHRMPSDLDGCRRYVSDMVSSVLLDNDTVHVVLGSLGLSGVSPPPGWLPAPLWHALRPLGGGFLRDFTVGTLPAALRARLGLHWTTLDRRRLQAAAALIRGATAPLPERLAQYPAGARARAASREVVSGRRDAPGAAA
jgi:uncharacterized protein (DUF2236 family)